MKQRIKRRKAALGTILTIGSALASIANSIINAKNQKKINENQMFGNNQANSVGFLSNLNNTTNANIQNELEEAKLNTINTINNPVSQFKYGGTKYRLKRKHKNYTDPYAKDWYLSIFRPNDWNVPGKSNFDRKQAALNSADYVESMYRYHQKKYLANRAAKENNPDFIGPPAPIGYISDTIKQGLQFENYDSRFYGPYNDNYPDLPEDYDKYKCGGRKRMKLGGKNVTSDINRMTKYI